MEILLTAGAIAERVRYVLEAPEGERYAIVAFIGARPLTCVKKPRNLHIYCWPSAGGTHPDGVDSLVKEGANVAFVECLHSKVYHSERGTVVGSANLSSNALGGTLTERAVYLPRAPSRSRSSCPGSPGDCANHAPRNSPSVWQSYASITMLISSVTRQNERRRTIRAT
jgi:hypothetical protein